MRNLNEIRKYIEERKLNVVVGKNYTEAKQIFGPSNIQKANSQHVSYISRKYESDFSSLISGTQASVVFIESFFPFKTVSISPAIDLVVVCDNSKKEFTECLVHLFSTKRSWFIHEKSAVSSLATIGTNVNIGAFSVIEENVVIGNNTYIGANVSIKAGTVIKDNVIIEDSTVIGGTGFGYVKNDEGQYINFPHFGRVIIEDNVYIGSNTSIDRGSLSDTIIKRGVKIDNLVHIAHNVEIGEDSLIIACSMIAGSVVIGKNCWVAPSASIRNALTIGENCTIGLGSTVMRNIESDSIVAGSPAIPIDDFKSLLKHQKEALKGRA